MKTNITWTETPDGYELSLVVTHDDASANAVILLTPDALDAMVGETPADTLDALLTVLSKALVGKNKTVILDRVIAGRITADTVEAYLEP